MEHYLVNWTNLLNKKKFNTVNLCKTDNLKDQTIGFLDIFLFLDLKLGFQSQIVWDHKFGNGNEFPR